MTTTAETASTDTDRSWMAAGSAGSMINFSILQTERRCRCFTLPMTFGITKMSDRESNWQSEPVGDMSGCGRLPAPNGLRSLLRYGPLRYSNLAHPQVLIFCL